MSPSRPSLVSLLLIATLFQSVLPKPKIHAYHLPSYVEKACRRWDPNLGDCIVQVGNKAVKSVIRGDPKYRIPKLEPLIIPEIKIRQGTPQVGIVLVCSNCAMYGLENAKFVEARPDMKAQTAEWDFFLDKLGIKGKYTISGKILLLPIQGSGDADVVMKNVKFSYGFSWDLNKKANKLNYVKVNNFTLRHEVGGLNINLGNLFNGDRLLGDNMNRFLNENWRELVKEMGPAVANALGQVFTNVLNAMGDLVPYEYMFPE